MGTTNIYRGPGPLLFQSGHLNNLDLLFTIEKYSLGHGWDGVDETSVEEGFFFINKMEHHCVTAIHKYSA